MSSPQIFLGEAGGTSCDPTSFPGEGGPRWRLAGAEALHSIDLLGAARFGCLLWTRVYVKGVDGKELTVDRQKEEEKKEEEETGAQPLRAIQVAARVLVVPIPMKGEVFGQRVRKGGGMTGVGKGARHLAALPHFRPKSTAMKLRKSLYILYVLLLVVLLGCSCGGRPAAPAPVGFINHTTHTDQELFAIWSEAQHQLAAGSFTLNYIQALDGAAPVIVPADSRALNIPPRQVMVAPKPDVRSAVIYQTTGSVLADPTGLIACPQPCDVRYGPTYFWNPPPQVYYAASWERTVYFESYLQYEFENQILVALGYDTRWR